MKRHLSSQKAIVGISPNDFHCRAMTSPGRESSACSSVCLSVTQRYVRLACPAPPEVVLVTLRPPKAVLGKADTDDVTAGPQS